MPEHDVIDGQLFECEPSITTGIGLKPSIVLDMAACRSHRPWGSKGADLIFVIQEEIQLGLLEAEEGRFGSTRSH